MQIPPSWHRGTSFALLAVFTLISIVATAASLWTPALAVLIAVAMILLLGREFFGRKFDRAVRRFGRAANIAEITVLALFACAASIWIIWRAL